MLENPYEVQNIYEVSELYNLKVYEDTVNVSEQLARQR